MFPSGISYLQGSLNHIIRSHNWSQISLNYFENQQ